MVNGKGQWLIVIDRTREGHQGGQRGQRVVRGQQEVKRAEGGLIQHHLKARGTQKEEMTILCPAKKVCTLLATLQRGQLGIYGGNSLTAQVSIYAFDCPDQHFCIWLSWSAFLHLIVLMSIFAFDCPDEHFCSIQCVSKFSSNQYTSQQIWLFISTHRHALVCLKKLWYAVTMHWCNAMIANVRHLEIISWLQCVLKRWDHRCSSYQHYATSVFEEVVMCRHNEINSYLQCVWKRWDHKAGSSYQHYV